MNEPRVEVVKTGTSWSTPQVAGRSGIVYKVIEERQGSSDMGTPARRTGSGSGASTH